MIRSPNVLCAMHSWSGKVNQYYTYDNCKDLCMTSPIFIHPSSEGPYYGMVMSAPVSVRFSVRPGPGLSPPVFHTFYTPVFRRDELWYGDVCLSVRVSIRQTQFSALFSYMLWHIELKFCMSLSFYEHLIKFECRQFPSIFVGVMPLLKLKKMEIQFSAVFSYMLWHIELKFCIWLCCTVLQIKFKCQFASIFVGVMPLLELRILKIHSFPCLSLTWFDTVS